MRIVSCVKGLKATNIGKQVREGVGRKRASKSEEETRDRVEAETAGVEGMQREKEGGMVE